MCACNPRRWEAEAGRPVLQGKTGLPSEFQDCQAYLAKSCSEQEKRTKLKGAGGGRVGQTGCSFEGTFLFLRQALNPNLKLVSNILQSSATLCAA